MTFWPFMGVWRNSKPISRLLLAALTALDSPGEEGEGLDPDSIKDYFEDALLLLEKAHVRLNIWRQGALVHF